jgi:hypothetical protein
VIKKTLSPAAARAASAYWTPERRASAIKIDIRTQALGTPEVEQVAAPGKRSVRGSAAPTISEAEAQAIAASLAQDYWVPETESSEAGLDIDPLGNGNNFQRFEVLESLLKGSSRQFPYIAIGKLFQRFGGVNYTCSAAVIAKSLVLTSRQCIFNGTDFADTVTFYPGHTQNFNTNLGGGWTARVLLTFDSGGQRFNIGILQMFNYQLNGCKKKTGSGPLISELTGWLGTFEGGTYTNNTPFAIFGYPGVNLPAGPIHDAEVVNGKRMYQCNGKQTGINLGGNAGTIEAGCDLTAGSQGGPWLHTFKPGKQGANNFVRSLTTHRLSGDKYDLQGPQLQADNFGALLNAGLSEPCP